MPYYYAEETELSKEAVHITSMEQRGMQITRKQKEDKESEIKINYYK